jgi:hypothetical protein
MMILYKINSSYSTSWVERLIECIHKLARACQVALLGQLFMKPFRMEHASCTPQWTSPTPHNIETSYGIFQGSQSKEDTFTSLQQ